MNMIWRSRFHLRMFLLLTTSFLSTHEADTINTTQTVSDIRNDTIISAGGVFALGFFSPGSSNNRYVGIWYNKIKEKTTVWVANKDNPLTDRSGSLRLVQPGHLVLLNATNSTIWSANISTSVQNPIARLLDSGNLVLTDENSNNLWQSFDHPTDTFLPGMKLGWNFKTGHEVYLTSSTNNDNPTSGDYTYHCDPTGYPQNVIKEGSSVRYKTGPWNGVRFSGSGTLVNNSVFTYELVQEKDEVYYEYELVNETTYMMFTLSESGVGRRWLWNYEKEKWIFYLGIPLDDCDLYGECGAYNICNVTSSPVCSCLDKFKVNDSRGWMSGDSKNACVRITPLDCEKGDAFLKYSGVKLPDTERSWHNESMTLQECQVACSKNCSCTAYASLDISNGENGCLLWFEDLVNMRWTSPGQDIYVRVASSELGLRSRKRKILIVTVPLATGVLLLILSMLLYYKKRKKQKVQGTEDTMSYSDLEIPRFDLSTLSTATDNFSSNNKLGEGGYGAVYKGVLEDGQEIAVKCNSRTSLQGVDEFMNEVRSIAKLQHRSMVKLLGCCIEGEERMLVYEYLSNKSLDLFLFDPNRNATLDWPTRFNIISTVARGLVYLHEDSCPRVIHRDLKTSNILLDSEMKPKISDFGLAKTFRGNETGDVTAQLVGTFGYVAPEYLGFGQYSVKSDVFSFGVIMLEIVSGRRNRGFPHTEYLLPKAWMLYREDRVEELVDPCLDKSHLSEMVRAIRIGLLCIQDDPDDRPNMSSVVAMLSNPGTLREARQPGVSAERQILSTETSFATTERQILSTETSFVTTTMTMGR